jgi:hypothetical protein
LSCNKNYEAIQLLKNNINNNKINWSWLSENSEAIELLESNKNKINWYRLSRNPSIFKLDYKKMRILFEPIAEEIIAKALHPKRMIRYMEQYNFDFEDWFD